MNPDYNDIISRLGEPLWWDEGGIPRYDPFHPDMCDIYATYAALMIVECRGCSKRFKVAVTRDNYAVREPEHLPSKTSPGAFWYGDPPRHKNCVSGEAMNTVPIKVLEFWKFNVEAGWVRWPEYEVEFEIDWGGCSDDLNQ